MHFASITPAVNRGMNPAAPARRPALLPAVLALAALTLLLALLPVQPAAAQEIEWVLTQTLINPDKVPLEYQGGGNNPIYFGEERYKDKREIYEVSETGFHVEDHDQDREYIAWDLDITFGFDAPKTALEPGKPYELTANFSYSGMIDWPYPYKVFSYYSPDLNFDPNEPLVFSPSSQDPGDFFKAWKFTVPQAEPGAAIQIQASLERAPGCKVIWKYEARVMAPGTDTTPQPDTNTQPLTASSLTPPEATATARPSSTESASAITPGEAGTRTFTEEEFEKMLADAAAFADTYVGIGGDYEKALLRKGYIGYIWSSEGDLSIYDHTGREVDAFDPRFWDDSNGTLKPIRIGDTIRTGTGRAVVHIFAEYRSDEHMLEIGSETEVVFTRFGTTDQKVSASVIEMLKGMIRFVGRVFTGGWRSDSIFSVRAGTTICGIRGSDVVISYDSKEDIVGAWVYEGLMDVTNDRTGETKALTKGQGLVVEDGELGAVLPLTEDLWDDITIASDLLMPSLAEVAAEEPKEFQSGDFGYVLLPDGTAEITRCFGKETSLTVPGTLDWHPVSSIGEDSFTSIRELTHLSLPDSVKRIGERAFWYCSGLKSVMFGTGLEKLAGNPFARCPALTEFLLPPDHPTLAERGGVLFLKPERKLVCYSSALPMKEYSVPLGILSIGDQAFTNCDTLENILLPDSIERIGD